LRVVDLGERVADVEQNQEGTFDVTLRAGITQAGEQLALQLATILGTLVAAISAFYFGTTAVTSAHHAGEASRTGLQAETPALSIGSITPASSPVTASRVDTILTGTGFVNGAQVKLMLTGEPDIDATNVTVVNTTRIACAFDLTNKRGGRWDVVAINPDGSQARKATAFQVT